jgi:RNA polymerase-binding transcription factor DksA
MATKKKPVPLKKAAPKKASPSKAAPKPLKKGIVAKAAPKKAAVKVAPKKSPAKAPAPLKKSVAAPVKKKPAPVVKKKHVAPAPLKKSVKPAATKPTKKMSQPVKKTTPVKSKPVAKAAPAKAPVKAAVKAVAKTVAKAAPVKAAPVKHAPAKAVKVEAPKKLTKVPEVKKSSPTPAAEQKVSKSLPAAKDIKVAKPKPVIIPKISTTSSRKYEPDFTRSVLDKPMEPRNTPTQRYSDNELTEFRELIQRKLEAAKKELAYLQGLITRKDEMGGDDTDNRYMTMEDGSLSMEREQLSQMASRQITFIDHLEKALMRIENKTYGICRVTGKLIDKARLRAVPHATLSIEAKMGMK